MPGGLFPVDRAAIHSRLELDQRIKVRAFAADQLLDQAFQRVPLKDRGALLVDWPDVGEDREGRVDRDAALVPGEAERSGPA